MIIGISSWSWIKVDISILHESMGLFTHTHTHTFQSGSFQKKSVLYISINVFLGVRLCSGIFLLLNAQIWKASISFPEHVFKASGRKSSSSKSMYKAGIRVNRYNSLSEKQHEEKQLGWLVGKNLTDAQQIWGSKSGLDTMTYGRFPSLMYRRLSAELSHRLICLSVLFLESNVLAHIPNANSPRVFEKLQVLNSFSF